MSNYKAYLRKQPTYDEITGYIHFGQDRITYPDRSATFMRDSPYLGIYDGITFRELEDQEQKIETEKLKEAQIRRVAGEQGITHVVPEKQPPKPTISALDAGGGDSQSSSWTSAPSTMSIFEGVRRKFSTKTPDPNTQAIALGDDIERERQEIQSQTDQQRSKIKEQALSVLSKTGDAVKSTAGALVKVAGVAGTVGSTVGSGALNVAGAVGSAVGSAVTNLARDNIEAVQFLYENNREPAIQIAKTIANFVASKAKSDITHLFEIQKLNFANLKKALEESRKMYQESMNQPQAGSAFSALEGPRTKYLTAADYNYSVGGTSSSSSAQPTPSGPPTSFAPSHATEMKKFNSIKEWTDHSRLKGFYMDQLQMRPGWAQFMGLVDSDGFHVPDAGKKLRAKLGKTSVEDLAKTLLWLDGKEQK